MLGFRGFGFRIRAMLGCSDFEEGFWARLALSGCRGLGLGSAFVFVVRSIELGVKAV